MCGQRGDPRIRLPLTGITMLSRGRIARKENLHEPRAHIVKGPRNTCDKGTLNAGAGKAKKQQNISDREEDFGSPCCKL